MLPVILRTVRRTLGLDTDVKVKGVKIGELARLTGASPRSLRCYEQVGLLEASRGEQQYRYYEQGAVERVSTIRSLLRTGSGGDQLSRSHEDRNGSTTLQPVRAA